MFYFQNLFNTAMNGIDAGGRYGRCRSGRAVYPPGHANVRIFSSVGAGGGYTNARVTGVRILRDGPDSW